MSEIDVLEIPYNFYPRFKEKPDDSLRDIAGRPTISIKPLFDNVEAVNSCVDRTIVNPLDETSMTIADWFSPEPVTEYYGHLDGSKGIDGFGIAFAHLRAWKGDPKLPYVKIDLLGCPNKKTYGEDFVPSMVEDIIGLMVERGFIIKILTFDRATDISVIERILKPYGTIVVPMSIDRCGSYPVLDYDKEEPPYFKRESTQAHYDKPMTELVSLINDGRLTVPYHAGWFDLPYTFEHDRHRRVVKKIAGEKDDLGQAVAGAVFHVLNNQKDASPEKIEGEWIPEEKPDSFEQRLRDISSDAEERRKELNPPTDRDFDRAPDEEELEDDYGERIGNPYYL